MRLAIATCKQLPEPDRDEALLLAALRVAGLEVDMLPWDDAAAPFAEYDLVVIRSTWNYFTQVDAFVAWVERTSHATRILNPPSIVAWNARKTYLADLDKRGVAIVPTEFVLRGQRGEFEATKRLEDILRDRDWEEVVVKPVVSAGSFRTERFSRATTAAGETFLAQLAADRDAMVQQWMPSVETYGERSLVWIDGAVTHAIRKMPRFAGGDEQVSGEIAIADDERAFAERALAPFASELLYGRVDMVRDAAGTLRVMELELIEPSLFFLQSPKALAPFVGAIARRG